MLICDPLVLICDPLVLICDPLVLICDLCMLICDPLMPICAPLASTSASPPEEDGPAQARCAPGGRCTGRLTLGRRGGGGGAVALIPMPRARASDTVKMSLRSSRRVRIRALAREASESTHRGAPPEHRRRGFGLLPVGTGRLEGDRPGGGGHRSVRCGVQGRAADRPRGDRGGHRRRHLQATRAVRIALRWARSRNVDCSARRARSQHSASTNTHVGGRGPKYVQGATLRVPAMVPVLRGPYEEQPITDCGLVLSSRCVRNECDP
jgi:hypothetical protein